MDSIQNPQLKIQNQIVTVFGSSLPGPRARLTRTPGDLGGCSPESGFSVANGGYAGLMEASAAGRARAGGHTIGVTCAVWPQAANPWIVDEVRSNSFLERIMKASSTWATLTLSCGGTGTLAELALSWEMMNKASLAQTVGGRKPLLVTAPYWQTVIQCLEQEASLASPGSTWRRGSGLDIVTVVTDAADAAERLRNWKAGGAF